MGLRDPLRILRKNFAIVVIVLATFLGMAGAYVALAPRTYVATAQLVATSSQETMDAAQVAQYSSVSSYISQQIDTYPQLVRTEAVLGPVLDDIAADLPDGYAGLTVADLAGMVSAANPSKTFMVNISAETGDPALSAAIANAAARELSDLVATGLSRSRTSPVELTVVQEADEPGAPNSPHVAIDLAIGLVAGIVLAVGAAFLKEALDTRIEDSHEVRAILDVSRLGSVVRSDLFDDGRPVVIAQPDGAVAEAYRRIRMNLTLQAFDGDAGRGRLIVVSSSSPAEGKTTTAINVAAALVESGENVLLVDADLRHPSVAQRLGIEGSLGLSGILSRQLTPKDVVQRYWRSNLHIMPAGRRPSNASLMINSGMMGALLDEALAQYSYVIVDTAPLTVANDGIVLGRRADGVVLVTGKGVVDRNDLRDAADAFAAADVPLLGFVFNFADPRSRKAKDYYYSADDCTDDSAPTGEGRSDIVGAVGAAGAQEIPAPPAEAHDGTGAASGEHAAARGRGRHGHGVRGRTRR